MTTTFPLARAYTVELCATDSLNLTARNSQPILVRNQPPVASFEFDPKAPVARDLITLTSTSRDADGPLIAQQWDLDGDGVYDDGTGETAVFTPPRAGAYNVALRVTDRNGAASVAARPILVGPRPPRTFGSAPRIRYVGVPTATGARLELLTVTAPKGAHVGIRCKGRACPYKHKRFTSKGNRVNLRKLGRSFPAGTVIEVRVTKQETIGTFTRIRIRAGQRPARLDRCLDPGKPNKLVSCDR